MKAQEVVADLPTTRVQHQHGEQGVGAPRDDAVHSNLRRGRSLFIGGAGIESHCPGEEHPSQAQELRPD